MKSFSIHYTWNGNEAFLFAAQIIQELNNLNNLTVSEWIDYEEFDWIDKCHKPSRHSILHNYICFIVNIHHEYLLDKHFPMEFINPMTQLMDKYEIDYSQLGEIKYLGLNDEEIERVEKSEEAEDYGYKLFQLFKEELEDLFVDDVFNVLYTNKEFLYDFNTQLQQLVVKQGIEEYEEYFKKDSVFKRKYIPTWLKKGVFFRDKGRCQLCGTDLTKLLTLEKAENIDHIIPLESGGTNDPINFQLTCESCNKSKGHRHTAYNSLGMRHWKRS